MSALAIETTGLVKVFDPAAMQWWLQGVVDISPITLLTTAVRGLMHGTATPDQLTWVLVWCAALIAVFGPLTMHLYRAKR